MRNILFDEKMAGHDPPRRRRELPEGRRDERQRPPLGPGQGPPERRPDRAGRRGRPGERHLADLGRSGLADASRWRRARELPDGDEDFPALIAALAAEGIDAEAGRLGRRRRRLGSYDLVLPRSTWDYAERRDDFLAWAASLPRVLNPLAVPRVEHGQAALSDRSRGRRRADRADDVRRARRRASSRRTVRSWSSRRSRPVGGARRGSTADELDAAAALVAAHPRRGPHGDGPAVPRRPRREGARLPRRRRTRTPSAPPRAAARGGGPGCPLPRRGARPGGGDRRGEATSPTRRSPARPRRFSTGAST